MNNISLKLHRPRLKNIIKIAVSISTEILNMFLFFLFYNNNPQGIHEKLFASISFAFMLILSLFLLFFIADGIRNLVAPATVILNNESLYVFSYPNISLKDISETLLEKNKKRTSLIIKMNDNQDITINQSLICIPVDTLKYAIDIRLEQIK